MIQSSVGARLHIKLAAELGKRCVPCGTDVSIMKAGRLKESWREVDTCHHEAGLESLEQSKETLGEASVTAKTPDY